MNTLELLSAIKSNSVLNLSCVGVFPSDKIPLPLLPGQSCIVNTDSSHEPGKHWILLFQTRKKELEFFCSYGMIPTYYHAAWDSLFYAYNSRVLFNVRQIQNLFSNTCGLHCLFCLYYRCLNISLPTILNQFYKSNTCFNDRYVSHFVNSLVNYNFVSHLEEPLQICHRMFDVVKS